MAAVFNDKMTALADAIRAKFSMSGKMTIDAMTTTINSAEVGGGGDSSVIYGYINSEGKFQALDLTGDAPADAGDAVTVDAIMFATGQDEPNYSVTTTASATDIAQGKNAVLNGILTEGAMPSANITQIDNVVRISAGKIDQQVLTIGTALGATEYTPGAEDIVIKAGKFLTGDQTIKAVAGGGGSMDFYRCAEYDDGGEIPAYSNITVSGVTSPTVVNATLIQTDKHATETNRVWQYGNYRMAFDPLAGYWCLYDKATILPWAETALFRLKIEGLSDNTGTSDNPTWWDAFVDSTTRWKTPSFVMEQDDNSGYYKRYFYLRLKSGTAYTFGVTAAQEWYSTSLYLYDSAGTKVAASSSSSEAVNGVTVVSELTYTPSADGLFKLEVDGSYDNYEAVTAICYPEPETSNPPATDPWVYSTWEAVSGSGTLALTAVAVDARATTGVKKWSGYKGVLDEDSNTWSFSGDVTEGLAVKGYAPCVGEVYSSDTVVWVQNLRSASDAAGTMVCLVHCDTAPIEDGKTTSFIDDSQTCVVKMLNQTSIKSEHPKFGSRSWYTNYTSSATDEMQLIGLPEMDAFTAEWWQYSSMNSSVWGGAALSVIDSSSTTTTITTPELAATNPNRKANQWFHHAFVREAGSSYVFEYINGVPIYRHEFTPKLGGGSTVAIKTGGGTSTNTRNYGDELAIFNYAKYNGEFRPPVAPYDTIISGLGKTENAPRAVTVSGIKVMHFANDPSYQLQNDSATGSSRVWVTADGKWYMYWDMDMNYCWVIANGTTAYSDSWICAAKLVDNDNDQSATDFNPIGHSGWVDYNDNTVAVRVFNN